MLEEEEELKPELELNADAIAEVFARDDHHDDDDIYHPSHQEVNEDEDEYYIDTNNEIMNDEKHW